MQFSMLEYSRGHSYFPSIAHPISKSKNSKQFLSRKRSFSPSLQHHLLEPPTSRSFSPSLQNHLLEPPTSRSLNGNYENDEKVISHFLIKYLERKQNYQNKNSEHLSPRGHCFKQEININPRFRRIYQRKIRQQKKHPQSRFVIGVI